MHIFTIDADLYVCKFAHIITSKKEPIYAQEIEKDKVLETSPHISLLVNAKFDIDEKLRALSSLLFEIDIESKQTIEILAKNGSLNEYQLGQSGYRYNLTRDSVRRRIVGTTSKISLEKENFIVVTKSN